MTYVHVSGGTNAGWKRLHPRPTAPWNCECRLNAPYISRCNRCRTPRPN